MIGDFLRWVPAVFSHFVIWGTGSVVALAILLIDKLTVWTLPRWLYFVLFIVVLIAACFETWRDEYHARLRDSALAVELAVLRDDFYSRMNDWWAICEFEDEWNKAFAAAETTRKRIHDLLMTRSPVLADEFNTQRADERLPEAIMLQSSGCRRPGVISVYWHRLDRLGNIIQKLQSRPLGS